MRFACSGDVSPLTEAERAAVAEKSTLPAAFSRWRCSGDIEEVSRWRDVSSSGTEALINVLTAYCPRRR